MGETRHADGGMEQTGAGGKSGKVEQCLRPSDGLISTRWSNAGAEVLAAVFQQLQVADSVPSLSLTSSLHLTLLPSLPSLFTGKYIILFFHIIVHYRTREETSDDL